MSAFAVAPDAATPRLGGLITSQATTAYSTMADLMQFVGADQGGLGELLAATVPIRRLHAGETLLQQGARVEILHFVRSGSFKIFCIEHDGSEQVLDFSGRTDMLGFDALCVDAHPTGAVALEDSTTFMIRVADLYAYSKSTPAFAHTLHILCSRALARQREQFSVMAAVSVEARLARFLLHLSSLSEAGGQSTRVLLLRMSRRDIASYLGVVHETISRTLKTMADWGLLNVANRQVEVLDMVGLRAVARGARRQPEEGQGARKHRGVALELGAEHDAEAARPARLKPVHLVPVAAAFRGAPEARVTAGAPIAALS